MNGTIKGVITDAETKETLIGVNLITTDGVGTITDYDGNYILTLPIGVHELKISYVGYEVITKTIEFTDGIQIIDIEMQYEANQFDDIVVSASKYARRASEEVISIEVIKPKLIDNTNAIRLDDVLKKVSGINIADGQANIRAGSGWSYSIGSRVNIVLDGQSLLTPDRSSIKWQYLPLESIGQIDILKGATSILYGSSAMNGTVHLQTIKPTSIPKTKFVSYIGVLDKYANDKYNWWDKSRITTGGYFSRAHKPSDKFEYVIGLNANYSELPYFEYADYHVRGNLHTKFINEKRRSTKGFKINFTHYQESEFIFWEGPDELSLVPIQPVQYRYINFNIDPYWTKFDKKDNKHDLKSRIYYYDPSSPIRGGYLNLDYQFHKSFEKKWGIVVGATQEILLAYDKNFKPDALQKAYKWAIYTQIDKRWDKVTITGGMRSEIFKFSNTTGAAYGFVKENQTTGDTKPIPFPLMRMGINYSPNKKSFVRFNIGQAFRLQSILETFIQYDFSGIKILANPDIKPEFGWTSELGFKQNWKTKGNIYSGSFDLAFFWQEYKDLIEFGPKIDSIVGVALVPDNLPTARIAGYELTLKQNISINSNSLNIDFGYMYAYPVEISGRIGSEYENVGSYIRDLFKYAGKIENTPKNADGEQNNALLKYRNRHLINANLEYSNDHFNIGFYSRYYSYIENGDFQFDSGDITVIPGITNYWEESYPDGDFVLDLNIGFKFNKNHSIALNIKNLTNNEYSLRLAKIEPPRSFTLQYKLNF